MKSVTINRSSPGERALPSTLFRGETGASGYVHSILCSSARNLEPTQLQHFTNRFQAVVFNGMTDLRRRSETVVLFFDIEEVRIAAFPRPIGRGPIEARFAGGTDCTPTFPTPSESSGPADHRSRTYSRGQPKTSSFLLWHKRQCYAAKPEDIGFPNGDSIPLRCPPDSGCRGTSPCLIQSAAHSR